MPEPPTEADASPKPHEVLHKWLREPARPASEDDAPRPQPARPASEDDAPPPRREIPPRPKGRTPTGRSQARTAPRQATPAPSRRPRFRRMVALPGSLLVVGVLVALVAAVRGSAAVLVVAGLLLLFAILSTMLRARRHLVLRRHQLAAIGFVVAVSAAVFVPASGAVDRCARVGRGDDLSGCDLSDRDLAGEDLRGADLRDANLRGTRLVGADLSGADLRGADLSGADLTDASAPEANFEDADFTRTKLQGNDFVGALGVTGDDFVAAFSVPRTHLAGETARRGVVLHDYDEIVDAVAPVHYGQAVPEVQPYEPNSAFHPAIVIDDTLVPGVPSWADAVQAPWAPTAIRYAELVVVVTSGQQAVEVCGGYVDAATGAPAAPIIRLVETATVRVLSVHDAQVIGEQTFWGSEPRQCSDNEDNTVTELVGNPPDVGAQARPWLDGIINAPERIR